MGLNVVSPRLSCDTRAEGREDEQAKKAQESARHEKAPAKVIHGHRSRNLARVLEALKRHKVVS